MKSRKRGGASVPCPECGGPTHVVITRRLEDAVKRMRKCTKVRCGHQFSTTEKA